MSLVRDRSMTTLRAVGISARRRWIFYALLGVLLLSLTQQFAKLPTDDLTSSGTWSIALAWSVPILMAGLGGVFSERAGVVNIGLEGMLIIGTWFGAFGTMIGGPWFGMLLAGVAGSLGGLIMAVAAVGFNVDHIIAGVAINLMAPGLARFPVRSPLLRPRWLHHPVTHHQRGGRFHPADPGRRHPVRLGEP